ncbi:hypothetical protein CR513_43131, partial [Mucuna pruriens]
MGTQGCINYNPSILLRQYGYLVIFPPIDESLSPLLVHGLESHQIKSSIHKPEEIVRGEEMTDQGTSMKRKLEEARAGKWVVDEEADRHKKNAEFLARRVRMEEEARFRTRECLRSADAEMCLRREERNRTMGKILEVLQSLEERMSKMSAIQATPDHPQGITSRSRTSSGRDSD